MSAAAQAAPDHAAPPLSLAADLAPELEWVRRALEGEPPEPIEAPSPALERVCALFGLSPFERSVLVLCAGIELDPRIAGLCADRGAPSFALALETLPGAHWSALAPAAPLRRWRLVRLGPEGPLTARPMRIEERILYVLVGIDAPEAELDGLVSELPAPVEVAPTHERIAERLAALLGSEREAGRWPTAQLCGGSASLRRDVTAIAAARSRLRLLTLDGGALPGGHREGAKLARLCAREAALSGAVLLLDLAELGALEPERREAALRFATGLEAALIVGGAEALPGLERPVRLDIEPTPATERRALWRSTLTAPEGRDSDDLAGSLNGALDAVVAQFELEPEAIRAAGRDALAVGGGSLADRLWRACRARARPALDSMRCARSSSAGRAQRIESAASWEELVLPEAQLATLHEIAAQVRWRTRVYHDWGFAASGSRGLGISVLLAGPSGTGKTMAAEVLANELRLDLYRIDLSSVVSKYIGETEKNLRRVFVAAERGGAVLLFDEADALFGKRTEVKDSHDRFANIEISYLLQRMEAYRGLAILTTNQREAIDDAFLRRLRFVVELPFPERAQRAAIWRRVLPAGVPQDRLDYERLAQLAIAGGNIRNVALGAAFLAADEGTPVHMAHVLRAARSEYAKLERSLTGPELEGWG